MVMKRNSTLNFYYVLCVVIVLLAYPIKNYSAIVTSAETCKTTEKSEKVVVQQSTETINSELLFK